MDITITELTDKVDINRGTFYLHCRDIYDLLFQIEMEMFEELGSITRRFTADELKQTLLPYLTAIFQYLTDNRDLCLVLMGEHGDIAFIEKLKRMVEDECFQKLQFTYQQKNEYYYEYFSAYAVSGCIGIFQRWLEYGRQESPEELAGLAEHWIMHGMSS